MMPVRKIMFFHFPYLPAPWGKKIFHQRTPGSRRRTPSPAAKNLSHPNFQNKLETWMKEI